MLQATPETPLADYLKFFYLSSRNLRPDSKTEYTVQVGNLERFWRFQAAERSQLSATSPMRPLLLSDLSDELVYAAMTWQLAEGRQATTANKLRRTINAIWRSARKITGTTPDNQKYRENVSDPMALLPAELEKLLAAAGERQGLVGQVPAGQWWLTAILFVYSLGARISAAYQVPTANLDLDRGEVLLAAATQKQRRDQRLDLFPGVVHWLRELRLSERGVSTVLGDYPWGIRTMRDDYTRLFVEAGLYTRAGDVPCKLKFHALRKTLASALFAAGGMPAACERMGHSSSQVTERYIDPRYKRQVKLNDLVKDPSPARLATPTLKIFRDSAASA
jgi:integrase